MLLYSRDKHLHMTEAQKSVTTYVFKCQNSKR